MINKMLSNRLFPVPVVDVLFVLRYADSYVSACLSNIMFPTDRTGDAIDHTEGVTRVVSDYVAAGSVRVSGGNSVGANDVITELAIKPYTRAASWFIVGGRVFRMDHNVSQIRGSPKHH